MVALGWGRCSHAVVQARTEDDRILGIEDTGSAVMLLDYPVLGAACRHERRCAGDADHHRDPLGDPGLVILRF